MVDTEPSHDPSLDVVQLLKRKTLTVAVASSSVVAVVAVAESLNVDLLISYPMVVLKDYLI